MRITRHRNIDDARYVNPETLARDEWKSLYGSRWEISRAQAYRETIENLFQPYTFPGGAEILYTTDAGDVLCAECARDAYLNERTDVSCSTYDEGSTLYCDACSREIKSSYGDPDDIEA